MKYIICNSSFIIKINIITHYLKKYENLKEDPYFESGGVCFMCYLTIFKCRFYR